MEFDNDLVVGKLRRWEKYLAAYRLPAWEQIPDLGLYMEQVVLLLRQYLDYLPPELKQPEPITAAAINNYVRTRLLPEPRKKRYYRVHIAYLIMICRRSACPSCRRCCPAIFRRTRSGAPMTPMCGGTSCARSISSTRSA